jgi:hypothetical protein
MLSFIVGTSRHIGPISRMIGPTTHQPIGGASASCRCCASEFTIE